MDLRISGAMIGVGEEWGVDLISGNNMCENLKQI